MSRNMTAVRKAVSWIALAMLFIMLASAIGSALSAPGTGKKIISGSTYEIGKPIEFNISQALMSRSENNSGNAGANSSLSIRVTDPNGAETHLRAYAGRPSVRYEPKVWTEGEYDIEVLSGNRSIYQESFYVMPDETSKGGAEVNNMTHQEAISGNRGLNQTSHGKETNLLVSEQGPVTFEVTAADGSIYLIAGVRTKRGYTAMVPETIQVIRTRKIFAGSISEAIGQSAGAGPGLPEASAKENKTGIPDQQHGGALKAGDTSNRSSANSENMTLPEGMIAVRNSYGSMIPAKTRVTGKRVGIMGTSQDIAIEPQATPIKKIMIRGTGLSMENGKEKTLYIDDLPKGLLKNSKQAYMVMPRGMVFSSAEATVKAKARNLYRCDEFDMGSKECKGRWIKIRNITPGEDYTIRISRDGSAYAELNILNVQSYPMVGGKWKVRFTTVGRNTLTIRAINRTTWDNVKGNNDLRFISLKCGHELVDYEWKNKTVIVRDYRCNDTSVESSEVYTTGEHDLLFTFGSERAYAHNDARRQTGYRVQQGIFNLNALTLNETIDPVANMSRAFLILSRGIGPLPYHNTNKNLDQTFVRGELSANNTITFTRRANLEHSYISYQVIEALDKEFRVFRGSGSFGTGAGEGNEWALIDIGTRINYSSSIALVYNDLNDASRDFGDQGLLTAYMTNGSHLRIDRVDGADVEATYNWQVIEFDHNKISDIITGESTASDHEETHPLSVDIGREVHLNSSILLWQHRTLTVGIVHSSLNGRMADNRTAQFYSYMESGSPSGDIFIRWYVIDFGPKAGYKESGQVNYNSTTTWNEATIDLARSVKRNRTIIIVGHSTSGTNTGRAYPRCFHMWNFTSNSSFLIQRGRYGQPSYLEYQLLELPFYIDYKAPIVSLLHPERSYFNDTFDPVDVTLNCSAYDEDNLVDNISIYITNKHNKSIYSAYTCRIASGSGYCNRTFSLYNGNYSWQCLARDSQENQNLSSLSSFKINFTDKEAPRFGAIKSQVSELGDAFSYDINATDNYAFANFSINSTAFSIDQSGLIMNATYLNVGTYHLNISANDTAGNYNHTVLAIDVADTTPPEIISIENITEIDEKAVLREMLAQDLSGIGNWGVNDTSRFMINSSGWLFNSTPTTLGIFWIKVTVNDTYNNSVSRDIRINITDVPDTEPPYFDPLPADIAAEYGIPFSLKVYGKDNIEVDTYLINDSRFSIDIYGTIRNATHLSIGRYAVNVTINDTAGNTNSTRFAIRVNDTLGPRITYITNITQRYDNELEMQFNATDYSGVGYWSINDSDFTVAGGLLRNATPLSVRLYWLNITASDIYNHSSSGRIYVKAIDRYTPRFSHILTDRSIEYGSSLSYDINATDDRAIDVFSVNDTRFRISGTGLLENSTGLETGTYSLRIMVNDTSGNTNTSTISIRINDTIPPAFTSLSNISIEFYSDVEHDFDAYDRSGIKNWSVDHQWFSITSDGLLTSNLRVPVGAYKMNITVIDNHGLTNTGEISVNVSEYTGRLGWFVQSGETQMGGTHTYVDIKPVRTDHAFIVLTISATSSYDEADQSSIYARFINESRIVLRQGVAYSTDSSYVGWEVIENPNLNVQYYNYTFSLSATQKDITLRRRINTSRTAVFMHYATSTKDATSGFLETAWTGYTPTSTKVRIKRDTSGSVDGTVSLFVVEFNDGSIIRTGELSNVDTDAAPTPIDLDERVNAGESWITFSHASDSAANNLAEYGVLVENYNASRWLASREVNGGNKRIRWYIITTPGAKVYNGTIGPSTLTTGYYPQGGFSPVQVNRSAVFNSYRNTGTGTTFANLLSSFYLYNSTHFQMRRGGSGNSHSVGWQVIEFPVYGISWDTASLDLGEGNMSEGRPKGIAQISSTSSNEQIIISCTKGACTKISHNFTDGISAGVGDSIDVEFRCSDKGEGNLSALFSISSSQDPSKDYINISCRINYMDILGNESDINATDSIAVNITIAGAKMDKSKDYTGEEKVRIFNRTELMAYFMHNFSKSPLDLRNITLIAKNRSIAIDIPGDYNVTLMVPLIDQVCNVKVCDGVNNRSGCTSENTAYAYPAANGTSCAVTVKGTWAEDAPDLTDVMVNESSISFSKESPAEGENITISGIIYNTGNTKFRNLTVQFINRETGGIIGHNITLLNFTPGNQTTLNVSWKAELGRTKIELAADPPIASNGTYAEMNETNNNASKEIAVGLWHVFYGNVEGNVSFMDLTGKIAYEWIPKTKKGHVLIADTDSSISWHSLAAIGKTASGADAGNDFAELDSNLGMPKSPENISGLYSSDGSLAKDTRSYTVSGAVIPSVPIDNSTNSSSFKTGILWDTSDDSNNEYDSEKEDIVFIAEINESRNGKYGTYDYEVKVPSLLASYKGSNDQVAIYLELR